MCVFDNVTDQYISSTVLGGNLWERETSALLGKLLDPFGTESAVFLDVGANLVCHTLYVAARGFRVWAVDPITMNHVKVIILEN